MVSFLSENAQKLLEQYKFDIDPSVKDDDLTCTICKKLIRDVYQSSCGCTFCRYCIYTHLTTGNQYCPGGNNNCEKTLLHFENNVCRSFRLNERISKVRVVCPHKLCDHITDLDRMVDHIKECTKAPMECPFFDLGCIKDGLSKDVVETHMNMEILTHGQLLMELLNRLKNTVYVGQSEIRSLQANINKLEEENNKKEEQRKEDEKEFDQMKKDIADLKKNLQSSPKEVAKINKQEEENNKKEEQRKEDESQTILQQNVLETPRDEQRNKGESDEMKKEKYDMKTCLDNMKKENDELKRQLQNIIEESRNKRKEIATFEENSLKKDKNLNSNTMIAIGEMNFTVATKSADKEILSPYFYSHANGYKLRMLICPRGYAACSGTHLSVYIQICKGEYDDQLSWPCKYMFIICMVDQENTKETIKHCRKLSYKIGWKKIERFYMKPDPSGNVPRGYSRFISLTELKSKESITIKCLAIPPFAAKI